MSLCSGTTGKKKREEIKKKNHKEINKHLLFPDLQLFGLRSACRQSQNKNPWMSICLHRFLLTCMRVLKILFYIYFISFHLTLSQSGPFTFCYFTALDLFSPMYISSFPICRNFVFNKVENFFPNDSRMQPYFHHFHSRFPTLDCPLLLPEH